MLALTGRTFHSIVDEIGHQLEFHSTQVESTRWQSQDVTDRPEFHTREVMNVSLSVVVPTNIRLMAELVEPNLPWADVHFLERVSGEPMNPPPSVAIWPFKQNDHSAHTTDQKFSHTYPERFYPKYANQTGPLIERGLVPREGIRFEYGDLTDLITILRREPTTRQAYLPIWFPEDLGAVARGERVPCSLGYHLMIRHGAMHCTYTMRSCDFLRHFRDDVYMAMRLIDWVRMGVEQDVGPLENGTLTMHVGSMHVFAGDGAALRAVNDKSAQARLKKLTEALG